tara:strand:- start:343 stop:597 length:255 start_codon:yes stop_codon:yes gene_type:complete
MKRLSQYLVDKLRSEQHLRNYNKANRLDTIEMNNYFKECDKIEIKGRFVSACKYALPIPERVIIKNDMSKYKLIKRYERNKKNS